jgi:hypothetical protein
MCFPKNIEMYCKASSKTDKAALSDCRQEAVRWLRGVLAIEFNRGTERWRGLQSAVSAQRGDDLHQTIIDGTLLPPHQQQRQAHDFAADLAARKAR